MYYGVSSDFKKKGQFCIVFIRVILYDAVTLHVVFFPFRKRRANKCLRCPFLLILCCDETLRELDSLKLLKKLCKFQHYLAFTWEKACLVVADMESSNLVG